MDLGDNDLSGKAPWLNKTAPLVGVLGMGEAVHVWNSLYFL